MKAIVIVDKNWGIGREGRLLVHLPGDLKYFRKKTMGHTLIMGRATVEGLPLGKALPGRRTLVLTHKSTMQLLDEEGVCIYGEEARICSSIEEIEGILGSLQKSDAFCAGGASVYEQLMPYCDEALVTVMDKEFPADCYFPNLPRLGWDLVSESQPQRENGVTYRFCVYRRPNQ